MISNTLILSLLLVAVPASVDAFRPPENPTGIPGLKKSSLVLKKPPSTKTATPPREENNQNVISPKTIERVGKAVTADNVARGATIRKRWEIGTARVASDYEDEYWYNPTIHTFGNIGFLGGIHAALAPISTKIIDMVAYDGEDIRSVVSRLCCVVLCCVVSCRVVLCRSRFLLRRPLCAKPCVPSPNHSCAMPIAPRRVRARVVRVFVPLQCADRETAF